MRDWHRYWNNAPIVHDADPLRQVGKTVHGEPIAEEQFAAIVLDIQTKLKLDVHDQVLDLCCGNGAITLEVAHHCAHVIAIDFSRPLLSVARRRFASDNIDYVFADVRVLPDAVKTRPISKIYMYEALQHFGPKTAAEVFAEISSLAGRKAPVYFGAVPDEERICKFYDTPARRADYRRRKLTGTEAIGYWWRKNELAALAEKFGFAVNFTEQSGSAHGAHYRFDALCTPKTG